MSRTSVSAGVSPRTLAFRRTATMLHVPAISTPDGSVEMFLDNPDELAATLEADRVAG